MGAASAALSAACVLLLLVIAGVMLHPAYAEAYAEGSGEEVQLAGEQQDSEASDDGSGESIEATGLTGTKSGRKIWLYLGTAAHFDGAAVQLQHYLDYYLGYLEYDPKYFMLVVNFNSSKPEHKVEYKRVQQVIKDHGLTYQLWPHEYSSVAHIKVMYKMFVDYGVEPHDWLAITDLDEFQELPVTPVSKYVDQLEEQGYTWVQGWLNDRVTRDGSLPHIRASPSMMKQFPLHCLVAKQVSRSWQMKVILTRAYLRTTLGNHKMIPANATGQAYYKKFGVLELTPYDKLLDCYTPLKPGGKSANKKSRPKVCKDDVWESIQAPYNLTLGHYKWHAGLMASAKRRAKHYKASKYGWYVDSRRIVEHLEKNKNHLDTTWSKFECRKPTPQEAEEARKAEAAAEALAARVAANRAGEGGEGGGGGGRDEGSGGEGGEGEGSEGGRRRVARALSNSRSSSGSSRSVRASSADGSAPGASGWRHGSGEAMRDGMVDTLRRLMLRRRG